MIGCYPPVLQSIAEFQAIIDSEYPELEQLNIEKENVLDNAYLLTMGEERLTQWEKLLNISPVKGSTLEDRRDTILARIRGQGKLNTELINTIVKTFTGGTANSYIKDGVLCIEITPPPENKSYIFTNVEQELKNKVPAHLGINVFRNYYEWDEVKNKCATWQDVLTEFSTWDDVLLTTPV
jgi:uncharacterized protein YmfQ (DUF2313 family)